MQICLGHVCKDTKCNCYEVQVIMEPLVILNIK